MKELIITSVLLLSSIAGFAQNNKPDLKKLLNHVVGGAWVSENKDNGGNPDEYKTFFMIFRNWADDNSVTGDMYGISNAGDTTQLAEIWNFIDKPNNNIFFLQRTTWGWVGTGKIVPYEEEHLDIQFKTRTDQGQEFYTRDIHFIEGPDKLKAVSQHKARESDDWGEETVSVWIRINKI